MILKMVSVCMDASSDYIYGSSVTLVISSELIVELCYNYSFISCDVLLVNFSRNEYSIVNGQIRRFHFSFLSFFLSFFFFSFLRLQNCPIYQRIEFFSNARSISHRKLEFCSWQILNGTRHIFDISR